MSDNTYIRSYKYRIYPTESQRELINTFVNLRRYVYNWGIAREEERYQEKKDGKTTHGFYSYYDLNRMFGKLRNSPDKEFLKKIPLSTARLALRDVANAYLSHFSNVYQGSPKFKSKKRAPKMFKTRNDRFYIDGDRVRFEGLYCSPDHKSENAVVETINLKFDTGFKRSDSIKYISPSISIDNFDNYWVSFSIEEPVIELNVPQSEPIGIDMGIRQTLVLSTREVFNRPNDKIKKLNKKLKRQHRHYTRDVIHRSKEAKRTKTKYEEIPISNRSQKRLNGIRKTYARITNIKTTWYHTIIKQIVTRNPQTIVIENIRVRELQQKRYTQDLKDALAHADFYTMRKIFEHKCNRYGVNLIIAPKEYPSSQICSNCGFIKDSHKDHGKHTYVCPNCGMRLDRDINAALNLLSLAYGS